MDKLLLEVIEHIYYEQSLKMLRAFHALLSRAAGVLTAQLCGWRRSSNSPAIAAEDGHHAR